MAEAWWIRDVRDQLGTQFDWILSMITEGRLTEIDHARANWTHSRIINEYARYIARHAK